jgi:hypothetical protein
MGSGRRVALAGALVAIAVGAGLLAPVGVAAVPVQPSSDNQVFEPGVTTSQPAGFEMRLVTTPTSSSPNGSCGYAIWAIVDDRPDAAYFTAILRKDGNPQPPLKFNRHYRGRNVGTEDYWPDPATAPGEIAAQLATGIADGAGDGAADCASLQVSVPPRFSIDSVVVTLFRENAPNANQAGYEVVAVPVGPAKHGTTGKDSCKLHFWLSVPRRAGAIEYTINLYRHGSQGDYLTQFVLKPGEFEPNTPDDDTVGNYKKTGRLGHYIGSANFGSYGCHEAKREWLDNPPRGNTPSKVTFSVKYPRCFGLRPTIVATSKVTNGTPGDDVILGRKGADVIDGKGGDDLICGLGGNDTLRGGPGRDALDGGQGTDTCVGGPGKTRLVRCERQ